ncbi:MAG: hypothetical protein ACJ72U_16150 [Nitrososphaeraceae archaeon]
MPYKQAVISAGQGSIAALSAYNYIQKLKGGKSSPIKADYSLLSFYGFANRSKTTYTEDTL